jgi:hypothetical protein
MKHIRQSTKQHAAGSFNITEDMTSLSLGTDLRAETALPEGDRLEKLIPVCQCMDLGDLKEDISQPAPIYCPGRCAAPGQALPLNMDQTALNHHFRPKMTKHLHHVRIAIYRKTKRLQSGLFQALKELNQLRKRVFRNTILAGYESVCLGIHQGNKTEGTVQVSPIKDKMLTLSQSHDRLYTRLEQIVTNHTVKFPWAIAALICQLPDRIAFNDPESKQSQFFFITDLVTPVFSTVSMTTYRAIPALFSMCIMTISPKNP